jgi:hypothetical protein
MIFVDYPGHLIAIGLPGLWALLMLMAYRGVKQEKGKGWRLLMGSLQYLAIVILLVILWNPSHIEKQDTTVRNTVLVFFDTSESMSIADCGGKNRLDKATDIFKSNFLTDKPSLPEYRIYGFDKSAYYAGSLESLNRWGSETRMHKVLNCIDQSVPADEFSDRGKVTGAIVLTDGQAEEKEITGYPGISNPDMKLIWIGVGVTESRSDVAVTQITAPPRPAIRTAFPVNVHLSGKRLNGQNIKVELYQDEHLIDVNELPGGSITQDTQVDFLIGADKLGIHCLTARVSGVKNEFNPGNNVRHTMMEVVEPDKLKVLFYSQVANFDIGKIRQSLERDKKVQLSFGLDALVARSTPRNTKGFAGQIRLPKSRDQFLAYDVIILGPCALDQLEPEQIDGLYAFVVDRGGGLILLPGRGVFDLAACENTRIKTLFPVEFSRNSSPATGQDNPLNLTIEGLESKILIENDLTTFQIQSTPFYHQLSPKPAARTLIDCGSTPLVCTHRVGRGFVAFINTYGLFEWYREDLQGGLLQRLMSGLASYTGRVNHLDAGIKLCAKRSPANPHKVIFEALVYDLQFSPVTDATVLLTLDDQTIRMNPADGNRYRAEVDNHSKTNFPACVEAELNKTFLGETKQVINLPPYRSEMDQVELDKPFLEMLAQKTSGKYLDADNVTRNTVKEFNATSQVGKFSHTTSVWPRWPLLILLCVLLSLNWFIKRRLGLV